MTQEKCERAVKALQQVGHYASHVQGAPNDHGVWIEVWNHDLTSSDEFRLHNEEIDWWASETKDK